jgi:hypothetical protein
MTNGVSKNYEVKKKSSLACSIFFCGNRKPPPPSAWLLMYNFLYISKVLPLVYWHVPCNEKIKTVALFRKMLQPHSPSPSLSDLLITAVHPDSYEHDPTLSPSISGDQDYSLSPNVFEFSFHDPCCKMPSVPCIADELFLARRMLPSDAEKPKCIKSPQEVIL